MLSGKPIIAHVAAALRPQCDRLVIVGRKWPGIETVPDYPAPRLGPLGGLCGALRLAQEDGYSHLLTAPCDTLPVPDDLIARFGDGGAFEGWPLIALWPTQLASELSTHLERSSDRSVRTWLRRAGLTLHPAPDGLANINTPDDLARLR